MAREYKCSIKLETDRTVRKNSIHGSNHIVMNPRIILFISKMINGFTAEVFGSLGVKKIIIL